MSTTRKIRCTDCGEAVPYGRLSCPSCGTLLASVTGGVRQAAAAGADESPTDLTPEAEAAAAAMAARVVEPEPEPKVDVGPVPTLQPRAPKRTEPRTPAQRTASVRTLVPTTVVRTVTAVLSPAAMPATAGAAGGAATVVSAGIGPAGWQVPSSATPPTDALPAVAAERGPGFFEFDHLDRKRVEAGLEWGTALGSGLVAVSLLLPWSRSVIGSAGVNSYFDSWGVAGPAHVVVLAWSIALLGLAVIPNRVPIWLSRAVAPLTLGVFTLGLTWPYAIGPLGGQIGVVLAFVAGIVLVATGLVGEWHTRHALDESPV